MDILAVGTGRCGTVSLTKWFNELFEINSISAQAAHEYLAKESYIAFDEYSKSGNVTALESVVSGCFHSEYNAVVGNGYATLLPYFAKENNNIRLIHIQRRDRAAWIASSARNAKFYPFAYKYFVPDELLESDCTHIPRTAAFQVGESSIDEWASWTLEEKLGWHYDYINKSIATYSSHFTNVMHVYTEDLNDMNVLSSLAKFVAPEAMHVPAMPKLNGHYFADIEQYSKDFRPYAQWLLGNIDWDKAVNNPAYLVTYAMNRFETWIGWCQSERAHQICPKNSLTDGEVRSLLKEVLPILERSINVLKNVK